MRHIFVVPVVAYLVLVVLGQGLNYTLLQILVAMWAAACLHDMAGNGERARDVEVKPKERTENVKQ